jgi:gluconolactonase
MQSTTAFLTVLVLGVIGVAVIAPETGSLSGLAVSAAARQTMSFNVVDAAAFGRLVATDASVRKVAGGFQFVEGPVWMNAPGGGYLLFSDLRANELKRWDPSGGVTTFRTPSGTSNGNTVDREGRLVTAEHDGRVSRTEKDGTVVTVVDAFEGMKLSSPNDVVFTSDGTMWFTDPEFGLGSRKKETPGNYVYRYSERDKTLRPVVTDMPTPNGLTFSPDESMLYVANSGKPPDIRAYPVTGSSSPFKGRVFATIDQGIPDGIRCDELGNVWSSSGDGVQIFSPAGQLIGRILLPESAANVAFGGPAGRTLFMTARTSVYAVDTLVRAATAAKGK